jgi:hypothetical protein
MANPSNSVVDRYFDFVNARIKSWQDHVDETKKVSYLLLNPPSDATVPQLVGAIAGLSLTCYDAAYGWLFPPANGPNK